MVETDMIYSPILPVPVQWIVFGFFKAVQLFSFFSIKVCPNSHEMLK